MAPTITLNEAAERLGLHYMTVYRYVRTGRLRATKVGAEWRVDPAAVEALRHPPSVPAVGRRKVDYTPRLVDRLVAGDEPGAWGVVEAALASGLDPNTAYESLLARSMQQIGEGWDAGTFSVADEHTASAVMMRLIGRLGPQLRQRGRTRGSVIVGAPPGDLHGVPVALLADQLRARRFKVQDLGANVPAESFAEAARDAERPIAVAIGATTGDNERSIRAAVRATRDMVDVPILLGGGAITDAAHAARLGADAWAARAPEVIDVIEAIARGRDLPPASVPA